jgi:hypothetical protein
MSELEEEFISEIDGRLPYDSEARWIALIERGVAISPNAAFMVLHEICNPPHSVKATPDQLKRMVIRWRQRFEHPVAGLVAEAAVAKIDGEDLAVEDAIDRMHKVAPHRNLYNALGILSTSCDDVDDKAYVVYEAIIQGWQTGPN